MTTPTVTESDLRADILDALEDAFWTRRAEIVCCRDCARNPAGICADHQADNDAAFRYERARKHLQHSPESPEVLAVLGNLNGGA